jgi:hypothetical protein
MFIRFIVAADSDSPWYANGVIAESCWLRDDGFLEDYQVEVVNAAFDWFNNHLPCPPFSKNLESGEWSPKAVSWFLPTAREPISMIWELVAVLRDFGTPVQLIRTKRPGEIVYRDDFQVVAERPFGF